LNINTDTGKQFTVLECMYGNVVPSSLGNMRKVGIKRIDAKVAGQFSQPDTNQANLLRNVCQKRYYGLPGEVCVSCPIGARCDGYHPELEDSVTGLLTKNILKYGVPVIVQHTTNGGLINVTECITCHTAPYAIPGFFNMKGYVNDNGESETVCDPIRKEEGLRSNKECENFVACDPPEACLGANICADGYANKAFPYRCSQCADGYYRSSGSCRQCPNNPELNIVFFFIVAVVAIGIGWFLNRKQVNIAFLTIGLDYIQVISIFASTRVAWPQQIKDLFRILSAFNLNIEIIAPECAFKGITYKQKWGMIMALPIAVFALLLVIHFSTIVYAVLIKGQSSRNLVRTTASPLIAMGQVLMYFLYLYITRSVFDVMTCRSPDPAEYDSKGNAILYMAGVYERCGVSGGTQLTLLGPAIAALVIYVLGYPIAIGYNLYKHQDLVMEDQLLRAKRVGDDRLTNPNAFEFRRRFSRAYYQFKPECFLWVLVILLRKFLIAISSLIFNTNQNFQMAAMLLVLFLAYAMQVRFFPYMGPKNFDEVLKQHAIAVANNNERHIRVEQTLIKIQARGRKKTYGNTFGSIRDVSVKSIAGYFGYLLFDYNVVESVLLASALLVSLAGIMFGATVGSQGSSFYEESRDGVMGAIIAVIALSIIYWLVVVVVEIFLLSIEETTNRRRSQGNQKSDKLSRNNMSAEDLTNLMNAPIDTQMNPMMNVSRTLSLSSLTNITGISADSIRDMQSPPEPKVWIAIREVYIAYAERAAELSTEVSKLKASISRAEVDYQYNVSDKDTKEISSTNNEKEGLMKKKSFGPVSTLDGKSNVFNGKKGNSYRNNNLVLSTKRINTT